MEFKYLLLLRFLLINAVAAALLLAAWLQGWVREVLEADVTRFCVAIFIVFLGGLAACTARAWSTSREINLARSYPAAPAHDPAPNPPRSRAAQYLEQVRGMDSGARSNVAAAMRHRLFSRIAYIRHVANSLVVFGLIGTVIGFIIALSGVDPDIATDPSAVSPMVAKLIEGMSVALYTTLVGGVFSLWLNGCFQVVSTGASTLFTLIVELGERIESAAADGAGHGAMNGPAGDGLSGGTVFRDVTMLALAGFVVIVLLLLPWLNPQGRQDDTTTNPPGSVVVELFWPNDSESDVDLWVQAPEDHPVGFFKMNGLYFNLLRDDRGQVNDATPINYETAYTRGISGGEHVANVHLFAHAADEGPIPVTVAVGVVEPGQRARTHLFEKRVVLEREGEERTVVRFGINRLGRLMAGSVHTLSRSLLDPGKRIAYRRPRREER